MGRFVVPILGLIWALEAGARPMPLIPEAPPSWPATEPTAATTQQGPVSLAQARQLALQRFPGRVVRAETVSRGNRSVHQIRILDAEGRVRNVRIDARTGAFL